MYFTESRTCAICEKQENEHADLKVNKFWICPDCCSKLKELITSKKDNEVKGIMTHHD